MQAIPGAENQGEIAYTQAITKLADLKREASKENISVQELQKIKEEILQVIQEAKDANSQQQIANDIVFAGLTFAELPPAVKAYYQSKGVTATTTVLPDRIFFGLNLPNDFTIPSSVTSIGIGTFYGATLPYGFTMPSSVTSIGNFAFRATTIPDGFTLSSSITVITIGTFYQATLPVGFTIPSSVTSIGTSAFSRTQLPNGTQIQNPPQPNGNDLTLNSDGTWSS